MTEPSEGRLLAEVNLNAEEPRFLTRLPAWLRDPLDGCTPGTVREAGTVLRELLTNAFRHAAPPYRARLTTTCGGHLVRLSVLDGTPGDAAGWRLGRGLILVRGLCTRWEVVPDPGGKTVLAELRVLVPPAAARSHVWSPNH